MDYKARIARTLATAAKCAQDAEEYRSRLRTAVALQDAHGIEFYTARVEFWVRLEAEHKETAAKYARELADKGAAVRALFVDNARATAQDSLARVEALRLVSTIASQNHVVVSAHGDALAFDFEGAGNGKRRATNARVVPLWKAPQFTKADAEILAAHATDGNGKAGRAEFINDAVDASIAALRGFLANLDAMEVAA